MLEIVLLILKIIGIILAVILGILIVALCLILFVPVRYRGRVSAADAEDGAGRKAISAGFSCTWLLRIVRVLFSYEETVRLRVRILFFTVFDTERGEGASRKEKGRRKKRKEERADTAKPEAEEERADTAKQETRQDKAADDSRSPEISMDNPKIEDKPEAEARGADVRGKDKPEAGARGADVRGKDKPETDGESAETRKEKAGFRQRISNILYTIRNFCDKLKGIKEKGSNIWEFWNADHVVASRSILGKEFFYLVRHLRPRKITGQLAFGFEDPSTTGYAMAVYGILYPIWKPDILVEPDFEKKLLRCDIKMKGRIRACHFLKVMGGLLLSKDVRHTIKDIRSGKVL